MPHRTTPGPPGRDGDRIASTSPGGRGAPGASAAAALVALVLAPWWLAAAGCAETPSAVGGGAAAAADPTPGDTAGSPPDASAASDAAPGDSADGLACVSDDDCAGAGPCRRARCVEGTCTGDPRPDLSPCDDGDACTVGTTCLAGTCGGGTLAPCDDGNPCTVDSCSSVSGCEHAAAPMGGACDDGDPCTHADACRSDGVCRGEPLASCACEVDADCAAHDDGNLCNGTFACVAGVCALDPASIITCPPAGPCRTSSCSPLTGQCVPTLLPDGTACDDQNPCTTQDACQGGTCAGTPGACPCAEDADCAPFAASGYDLCQGGLRCAEGVCAPDEASKVACPPAPPGSCAVSACDPATGLCEELAVADGTACDGTFGDVPADACAGTGVCSLGVCVLVGSPCDDGDPCTADACDATLGCLHTPADASPCDDGDPCTTGDVCVEGACAGTPRVCDDGDDCTLDWCDPQTGTCEHGTVADDTPCGATACTSAGTCQGGVCEGVSPVTCPSVGPCTTSECVPGLGCVSSPAQEGAPCDDGDPCSQQGTCSGGVCQTLPIPCADDNPCTADSCDPAAGGCVHVALSDGVACYPDDPCALAGKCVAGQCATTQPVECPPVPCTQQACAPDTGQCETVAWTDGEPCDAGPCAQQGVCLAGACLSAGPLVCEDGDACTADLCDPELGGCVHMPSACTADDTSACAVGTCGELGFCEDSVSALCTDGFVLLDEPFPCAGPPLWTLAPQGDAGGLTVAEPGLPPGPFGVGCALGFVPDQGAPWGGVGGGGEATATRGGFYVPTGPGSTTTVRVRLFEASAPTLEATRSLRLLDADGAVWAEATWSGGTSGPNAVAAAGSAGGWQERTVELDGVGPGPWYVQIAVQLKTGPGSPGPDPALDSQPAWWWLDHLVVSAAVD